MQATERNEDRELKKAAIQMNGRRRRQKQIVFIKTLPEYNFYHFLQNL